jgi:hypothetical protein
MKYCLKLSCATLLLLALSFSSLVGCFGEVVDIGAEDESERAEATEAPIEEQTEQLSDEERALRDEQAERIRRMLRGEDKQDQ